MPCSDASLLSQPLLQIQGLGRLFNDAVDAEAEQGGEQKVEAASGFEPLHRGFADLSLNHLGTPPFV